MKTLFLCSFTLRVSRYMNDGHEDCDYTRIVRAKDESDARRIIEDRPEFKTDEYAVYRNVMYFEADPVLEDSEDE